MKSWGLQTKGLSSGEWEKKHSMVQTLNWIYSMYRNLFIKKKKSVSFSKLLMRLKISQIWYDVWVFLITELILITQQYGLDLWNRQPLSVSYVREQTWLILRMPENINHTGHVKTLSHRTLRYNEQHAVHSIQNLIAKCHPSLNFSTHISYSRCSYMLNQSLHTENLWAIAAPLLHPLGFFPNVWMRICSAVRSSSAPSSSAHPWLTSCFALTWYTVWLCTINVQQNNEILFQPSNKQTNKQPTCFVKSKVQASETERCYWWFACFTTPHRSCRCGIIITRAIQKYHLKLCTFLNPLSYHDSTASNTPSRLKFPRNVSIYAYISKEEIT